MGIQLITENVWHEITTAVKKNKSQSIVAVAYFAQNGASMLPLSKGSTLLVDASEKAVKSGQTCPAELIKLYNQGVNIYSLPNLHANMYVIGKNLIIGSANVSGHSANVLKESIIKTDDVKAIKSAIAFITSFCKVDLGLEELTRLDKLYVAPKNFGIRLKQSAKVEVELEDNLPNFFIYNLVMRPWTEEEEKESKKGRIQANKNRKEKSRHILDEFTWSREIKAKKGDYIVQIIKDGNQTEVAPVGRLIHVRKWSNGTKTKYFCYVEVPDKKRKPIDTIKKSIGANDSSLLKRSGNKPYPLAEKFMKLWK